MKSIIMSGAYPLASRYACFWAKEVNDTQRVFRTSQMAKLLTASVFLWRVSLTQRPPRCFSPTVCHRSVVDMTWAVSLRWCCLIWQCRQSHETDLIMCDITIFPTKTTCFGRKRRLCCWQRLSRCIPKQVVLVGVEAVLRCRQAHVEVIWLILKSSDSWGNHLTHAEVWLMLKPPGLCLKAP